MKIFSRLIIVLCVLFSTRIWADAAGELTTLMGPINTFSASFTQTIYDNKHKQIQDSAGKMALSRPGKFRWEVYKPQAQTIIANGNKVWVYDPDLQQVTIRGLNQTAGESPATLLSNNSAVLQQNYNVKELPAQGRTRWFKLTPKQKDNDFQAVQLGFTNNQITQMVLQDNLGHTTQVAFNNIKSNTTLANSLFVFKAPANVDVLDESKK